MDGSVALVALGLGAAFALTLRARLGRPWSAGIDRGLRLLAFAGALIALARFAAIVAGWLRPDSSANTYDFAVFYGAGRAILAGQPLYDLAGIRQDPGRIVVYRHAPIGAALFAPLALLPFRLALDLWRLLNVALYLASLALLLRHFRVGPRTPLGLGLISLWLVSAPGRDSLASGQWDTPFLFATTAALLLFARGRDGWAGACLALPIAIKFYPALLLLGPLLERRYRALVGCALAGGALMLAGLLVGGLGDTRVFIREVLPTVGGGTLYYENQAPYALIGRLLATELRGNGLDAAYPARAVALVARGVAALVILASAFVIRHGDGGRLGGALRLAMLTAASLLIIPTAWSIYLTWLALPLAILGIAIARLPLGWPVVACFAVAALLLPFGVERTIWGPGQHDGAIRLVLTYKAYGVAALWAGTALAAWAAGRGASRAATVIEGGAWQGA